MILVRFLDSRFPSYLNFTRCVANTANLTKSTRIRTCSVGTMVDEDEAHLLEEIEANVVPGSTSYGYKNKNVHFCTWLLHRSQATDSFSNFFHPSVLQELSCLSEEQQVSRLKALIESRLVFLQLSPAFTVDLFVLFLAQLRTQKGDPVSSTTLGSYSSEIYCGN